MRQWCRSKINLRNTTNIKMDYLDPEKKRIHRIQLFIGYGLFAIVIAFGTVILAYLANGYYLDRDTGSVIQNGLVFVDSRPGGADVFVNEQKQQGKTDSRLVIPSGEYDIAVRKEGYREWNRSLTLEGGSLRKLTYARLIPESLSTANSTSFRSQPIFASQSINKKWLVLSHADEPLNLTLLNLDSQTIPSGSIVLPASLVTEPGGVIEVVEWSDNNRVFLASYTTPTSVEYLTIDREIPENSTNVSRVLGLATAEITLLDRNDSSFFVFNSPTQQLFTASIGSGISTSPIVDKKLLSYKTFTNDWLLYVVESGEEGLVDVRFKRGDKDILLKQLKTDKEYLLELAKLGNAPIMGISSPTENRAIVYNDPEKFINENPEVKIPVATTVLRVPGIQGLTISSDSSIIMGYGQDNFASHEFEADRSYNFAFEGAIDPNQELRWMDGQHLLYSSGGIQRLIDFDGSNSYDLVASIPSLGSFYTNSIERMFAFAPATPATETVLETPARLTSTSLLTTADQ